MVNFGVALVSRHTFKISKCCRKLHDYFTRSKQNIRLNSEGNMLRFISSKNELNLDPSYLHFHSGFEEDLKTKIAIDMIVTDDFLTSEEEKFLFEEVEPYMKRLRYEFDHWDDAIHGYRETERLKWTQKNMQILNRARSCAFPPGALQLSLVHVLDLSEKGVIKPHIDSVRFCGNIIAGLSLLSDSVMRLVHHERKDNVVDVLLKRRSIYIMKDSARYDFTHEILGPDCSNFSGMNVPRHRRISIICRNGPIEQ